MKKLMLGLLLLTGCASTYPTVDNIKTVEIGDDYGTMLTKMGHVPNKVKCLEHQRGTTCTATYTININDRVFFRFNNNIVSSIYY